jgi:DAK2 domain fusion protein YloV
MDSPSDQLTRQASPHSRRDLPLDGQVFKQMAEASLCWLKTNQQTVNALNVFPVPDGDTGTNMVLTMQAACSELNGMTESNVGKVAHALAHGALMGARGNSGVILSQIWRGFARALDNQEFLDGNSLVHALALGRDTAYKGVVRPVEGTILTVAKDIAAAAEKTLADTANPFEIFERIVPAADASVKHTPELLPVLKEAGVVDSGGMGLFFILEGIVRFMNNQPLDIPISAAVKPLEAIKLGVREAIEPGQDYEVVIDFHPHAPLALEKFYQDLEQMGTSIQIGEGDGMYRLHIHVPTDKRYSPIDYAMGLGTITKVAMENLLAQTDALNPTSANNEIKLMDFLTGQIAVVAVSPGIGFTRVFASLGAAAIVEGGQTMNPSTQEILHAFKDLPTDKVIILPNNKNIIMAAQAAVQAASQTTNQRVVIVPSQTVPQGLAAILRLIPMGDMDEVVADMLSALDEVNTGEITTATRSVEIDGVAVQQGQLIALYNGKLVLAATDLKEACLGLLEKAHAEERELVTLFSGSNITKDEIQHILETIRITYPNLELEIQDGGQPHYQFIISIE